jgi:hypothetical protein
MQGTRVTRELTLEVKYFTVPIARYAVLTMPALLSCVSSSAVCCAAVSLRRAIPRGLSSLSVSAAVTGEAENKALQAMRQVRGTL